MAYYWVHDLVDVDSADDDAASSSSSSSSYPGAALQSFPFHINCGKSIQKINLQLRCVEELAIIDADLLGTGGGTVETADECCVDPTGNVIWPGALLLAELLIRVPHRLLFKQLSETLECENLNIIELGAGAGLCGLLAATIQSVNNDPKGVSSRSMVVMTDGNQDTVRLLVNNARINTKHQTQHGLLSASDVTAEAEAGVHVCIKRLLWGSSGLQCQQCDELKIMVGTAAAAAARTDAATAPPRKGESIGFDVVLASDVIYEEEVILPLLQTAAQLLRSSPSSGDAAEATATAGAVPGGEPQLISLDDVRPPCFVLAFVNRILASDSKVTAALVAAGGSVGLNTCCRVDLDEFLDRYAAEDDDDEEEEEVDHPKVTVAAKATSRHERLEEICKEMEARVLVFSF